MKLRQPSNVGPGDYPIPQKAIEGSKYSMRGINYVQQEKKYGSLAPGPGAYNQDKAAIETSLRYSMGENQRVEPLQSQRINQERAVIIQFLFTKKIS